MCQSQQIIILPTCKQITVLSMRILKYNEYSYIVVKYDSLKYK